MREIDEVRDEYGNDLREAADREIEGWRRYKISELIAGLQAAQRAHGDLAVVIAEKHTMSAGFSMRVGLERVDAVFVAGNLGAPMARDGNGNLRPCRDVVAEAPLTLILDMC